jgi:hypothetical protein
MFSDAGARGADGEELALVRTEVDALAIEDEDTLTGKIGSRDLSVAAMLELPLRAMLLGLYAVVADCGATAGVPEDNECSVTERPGTTVGA